MRRKWGKHRHQPADNFPPQIRRTVIALQSSIDQQTLVPFTARNSHLNTSSSDVGSRVAEQGTAARKPRDPGVAQRKLQLLKRSGLFGGDTRGAVIARACSMEDLRTAYRLVHDVYAGTGFILPEPSGIRLRIFETSADTATFVAKVDGRVVGVLSVVCDSSDLGLPSDSAFKPELDALRARGLRLCELTNQAVAPEYRKTAVATELMRCAFAHGIKAGFHQCVAAVSPSHDGFYELIGFRCVGSLRSYSDKLYDPVVAMAMDLSGYRRPFCGTTPTERFLREFAVEENQYLSCVGEWNRQARDCFLSEHCLTELFVRERRFLDECSRHELRAVLFRWGRKLFAAVITHGRRDLSRYEFGPILSATIVTRTKPAGGASEGFTFLNKGIFVRSLTSCRSRSFHRVHRQPAELLRRSAKLRW